MSTSTCTIMNMIMSVNMNIIMNTCTIMNIIMIMGTSIITDMSTTITMRRKRGMAD